MWQGAVIAYFSILHLENFLESHENLSYNSSSVRVPIKEVSVAQKLNATEKCNQDPSCLFCWDHRNSLPQPWKSVPSQVSVKSVSLAQKPSTIKEWYQNQCCLLQQRDCRTKGHNPKNSACVWVPMKTVFVAWKLAQQENRANTRAVCFGREGTETKAPTWREKDCPGFQSQWRRFHQPENQAR